MLPWQQTQGNTEDIRRNPDHSPNSRSSGEHSAEETPAKSSRDQKTVYRESSREVKVYTESIGHGEQEKNNSKVQNPEPVDSDKKEHLSSNTTYRRPSIVESTPARPTHSSNMPPQRVDSSSHRRDHPYAHMHPPPSPPPIATLTQSPSLSAASLDRSAVSTPNSLRRSPPRESFPSNHLYSPYPPSYHHHQYPSSRSGPMLSPSYSYSATQTAFDHRYDHNSSMQAQNHQMSSAFPSPHLNLPGLSSPPSNNFKNNLNAPSYPNPGQNSSSTVYTDDAATKLSDRVRRRCFNCCTTDTSTWRRSNLSPGKVLCNKCGLFERTHSRPRPEQFPHKRGPLASTSLRRSPPPSSHLAPQASYPYHTSTPSHPDHPELRKDYSSTILPEIQSWVNAPRSGATSQNPSPPERTQEREVVHSQHARAQTPPSLPGSVQQPSASINSQHDLSSGNRS